MNIYRRWLVSLIIMTKSITAALTRLAQTEHYTWNTRSTLKPGVNKVLVIISTIKCAQLKVITEKSYYKWGNVKNGKVACCASVVHFKWLSIILTGIKFSFTHYYIIYTSVTMLIAKPLTRYSFLPEHPPAW